MKSFIVTVSVAAAFVGAYAAPSAIRQGGETVRLVSLDPVSSDSRYARSRGKDGFAMGGKAYRDGLSASPGEKDSKLTYAIPARALRLTFEAGMNDVNPPKRNSGYFAVSVDGELVAGGPGNGVLKPDQKPIPFDLDVKGKNAVQFVVSYGGSIGDPVFFLEPKAPPAPKKQAGVPQLTAPAEKAVVAGERVTLKWSAVEGAVSYGISVVSYRSDASLDSSAPRMWCATTNGTSHSFDLSKLPKGEYMWSVIAFGPKRPLGGYSAERIFLLDQP